MPTLTAPPTPRVPGHRAPAPLTLAEHLEELRRRLGLCLVTLVVAVGIAATSAPRLIEWLRRPAEGLLDRFAFFSPTEPLMAYVKVACLGGAVLAMPVILWQLWGFVRTGLTLRERSYGVAFVWCGTLLFIAGAAFAYYLVVPVSLTFLLRIGQGAFVPVISIDTYLSFVTAILFWCGLVFELPVVLSLLAKVGVVTPEWLRQSRPYAVLILLIVAALVTPTTDPITLLLLAIPLWALYEAAILMARWGMPRRLDERAPRSPRPPPRRGRRQHTTPSPPAPDRP